MSNRYFMVAFRWVTTSNPSVPAVEAAVAKVGAWARLNIHTWMLKSEFTADQIHNGLASLIKGEDSILVIAIDPTEAQGWLPAWIWEWLGKTPKNEITSPKVPAAPPSTLKSVSDLFARKVYSVITDGGQWKVEVDGVKYGPYIDQHAAINAARVAAKNWSASYPITGAEVRVQTGLGFTTDWIHENALYPPKP